MMPRCQVTDHPVGTDTWEAGGGCYCPTCSRYRVELAERERDELKAELEMARRAVNEAYKQGYLDGLRTTREEEGE